MVKIKLEVSKIVNIRSAIPGKVRVQIYKLSKMEEFQHPEFVWKRMPINSLRNRSNVGGRTNNTINMTKKLVLCKAVRAGKPNYSKIGKELNISENAVRMYLTKGHEKMRERFKNNKVYHDKCCAWQKENKEKILKRLSKIYVIRKEYYDNIDEDEKFKRMLELSNKILYDPVAWKDKKYKSNICIKCKKLLSRHSNRKMKGEYTKINALRQTHCTKCLMSEIAKIRTEVRFKK